MLFHKNDGYTEGYAILELLKRMRDDIWKIELKINNAIKAKHRIVMKLNGVLI